MLPSEGLVQRGNGQRSDIQVILFQSQREDENDKCSINAGAQVTNCCLKETNKVPFYPACHNLATIVGAEFVCGEINTSSVDPPLSPVIALQISWLLRVSMQLVISVTCSPS